MSKVKPPVGYDDNPEWTEKDFARARKAGEVHGPRTAAALVRKAGRPTSEPTMHHGEREIIARN